MNSTACRTVPTVLLAGDGPDRVVLQGMAARPLSGKVCFLGHQTIVELAQILPNCDVFLHPNPKEPVRNEYSQLIAHLNAVADSF
jgi:glycosyltransferase involved in cell wall biosynthesis